MRRFLALAGVFLLAACSSGGEPPASQPPLADTISCHAAYRADVSQPIEREETITFGADDDEQSVAFADMVFHAAYSSGELDGERALRVWVTDAEDTTVLQSHLYQLDPASGPVNQFVGGHGFTGLNYGYHPTSSAELQFWCEVG
jgi:hypothetical protein